MSEDIAMDDFGINEMLEISCKKASANNIGELSDLFPNDLESRIQQVKDGIIDIYYVEHNGCPVGRLIANYDNQHLNNETIPGVRVCLSHFILFKDYRNKRLGGKLLAFALHDLRARGYKEFTVGVEEKNHIAKHLYGKNGFTEIINHGSDPCEYNLFLLKD